MFIPFEVIISFLGKYPNKSIQQHKNSIYAKVFHQLFFFLILFIYLFIFGCVGFSLLRAGFLYLQRAGAVLRCGARASHCGGFSLQSTGSRHEGFSSSGTWAQ